MSIWQKSQRRVHWLPPMRNVASRSSQHSKMLGQPASWHTVCRPSDFTKLCNSRYSGPMTARVLIQAGFFSMGVWAFFASILRRRRGWVWVTPASYLRSARTPQRLNPDVS